MLNSSSSELLLPSTSRNQTRNPPPQKNATEHAPLSAAPAATTSATSSISQASTASVPTTTASIITTVVPTWNSATADNMAIAPSTRSRRWNSTELRDWLEVKNMNPWNEWNKTLVMSEVMNFAPKPQGTDVEIYNTDAWHRLRVLLGLEEGKGEQVVTHSSSNTVILCSNGGSSTAGAWNVLKMDRYDEVLAAMIRARTTNHTPGGKMEIPGRLDLSVVNQGHGGRGSMHSALLMHSFISADTDVIIWEFAVNDLVGACELINSVFLVWLDQVARHSMPPPLVVLAYLWDDGVKSKKDERIGETIFECHDRIAAAYDFVVGSINLASYLNKIDWDYNVTKKSFVADRTHPNQVGHLFIANLLWDLVIDDKRLPIIPSNKTTTTSGTVSRPKPHWTCQRNSPTKKHILYIAEEKHAFASWTSEFPRNHDGDNGGMLSPQMLAGSNMQNPSNFTYELNGKATEFRQDRKYSIILPLCATGERLGFDLSSTSDMKDRGKWLSACQMYFPEIDHGFPSVEWLKLRQDVVVEIFDAEGAFIELGAYNNSRPEFYHVDRPRDPCWRDIGGPWLLLPNETLVSRITFCNGNSSGKKYSLERLVIF